jgi:hypothetical protein
MAFCLANFRFSGISRSECWNGFLRESSVNNHVYMKNIILFVFGVSLLASCSAPKYSYYFDHYNYNSGKKQKAAEPGVTISSETLNSPLHFDQNTLLASTDQNLVITESQSQPSVQPVDEKAMQKKFSSMTRDEKKAFKKELKTEVKNILKSKKKAEGNADKDVKVMDYNLKMAIIFAAVAVTLSFFGGVNSVFWILSVVALVIGVVFFIKWLAEQ